MRSPCNGCAREFEDKNSFDCMACPLRLEYVGMLGPVTENVPIEQTDLVKGAVMGKGRAVTDEEKQFVRENMGRMKTFEIAHKLQRNINTVYKVIEIIRREARQAEARRLKPGGDGQQQAELPLGATAGDGIERVLSLAGRPGLFEKLKQLAEAHYRSVEQELCWIVAQSHRRMSESTDRRLSERK